MKELLEYEKQFLINHNVAKRFEALSNQMNTYSKSDILWVLYNELLFSYQSKQDYFNCFLVYKQMSNQLYREKNYEQALEFLILALYIRVYEISQECIELSLDSNIMYERHIAKFHKDLKKYMKSANIEISDIDNMCAFIEKIINHYLSQFKNDFWIYWISFKYISYIT